MFDRFTDHAKKVMACARQESLRLQHEYIGTEHILLGLLQEGSGVAVHVLKGLGFDLAAVRAEVERLVKPGRAPVALGQLPFTPRAKKVLELAMEEASGFAHNYFGTEHLLLGLIAEHDGIAARALLGMGAKLDEVREEIREFLGELGLRSGGELGLDRSARSEKRLLENLVAPVNIEIRRGLACVVIGADLRSERLHREGIVPALSKLGYEVVRTEDLGAPDTRLADIWQHLCTAELVLIVVRDNPSLGYVLGFCHGALRCPVLLVESGEELPESLGSLPRLQYRADPPARLAEDLEQYLSGRRR